MVEISSSGSGGGPGWETAPGYPTVLTARSYSIAGAAPRYEYMSAVWPDWPG